MISLLATARDEQALLVVLTVHAAALEKTLSRLAIVVPPAVGTLGGFVVRRDGEEVGPATWGSALPVDPGVHAIEASASGKLVWKTTVMVGPVGQKETVTVAPLDDGTLVFG